MATRLVYNNDLEIHVDNRGHTRLIVKNKELLVNHLQHDLQVEVINKRRLGVLRTVDDVLDYLFSFGGDEITGRDGKPIMSSHWMCFNPLPAYSFNNLSCHRFVNGEYPLSSGMIFIRVDILMFNVLQVVII